MKGNVTIKNAITTDFTLQEDNFVEKRQEVSILKHNTVIVKQFYFVKSVCG